ncbi:hypothetical protein AN633_02725 [Klebsiella pneumoniae]|nr:hypothetical protein KPNIH31_18175 [Klebsiella pneumoniae subsp. pneumoniae]KUG47201.1 hypothetical protein AN633_02725 [Klebsiella pneumoniae]
MVTDSLKGNFLLRINVAATLYGLWAIEEFYSTLNRNLHNIFFLAFWRHFSRIKIEKRLTIGGQAFSFYTFNDPNLTFIACFNALQRGQGDQHLIRFLPFVIFNP